MKKQPVWLQDGRVWEWAWREMKVLVADMMEVKLIMYIWIILGPGFLHIIIQQSIRIMTEVYPGYQTQQQHK